MKKIIIFTCMFIFSNIFSQDFDAQYFFQQYDKYRLAPDNLMMMNHALIVDQLHKIDQRQSGIVITKVGESVEKRSINMCRFGKGPTKFLLWSQMHGNEPTASASLLAIFNFFSQNMDHPFVQFLHDNIEINAIIMLNPDGAEKFRRRNAMDIDINRDARLLQTPEGKTLKAMKDEIQPRFGFNLHDMYGRESVGDSRKVLKIALMAPPFNEKNEDSKTRIRAKQMALHVKQTLDIFIEGHVAKYKAGFMPRAFGDAMQNWGVSTVLIESGRHLYDDPREIARLNFVALLSAFQIVASNKLDEIDHNEYDKIPLEGVSLFDILLKDIKIYNGMGQEPFDGNIGINVNQRIKDGMIVSEGIIQDIGDLMTTSGIKVINDKNLIAVPGFIIKTDKLDQNRKELMKNGITSVCTHEDTPAAELADFIIGCSNTDLNRMEYPQVNNVLDYNDIFELTSKNAGLMDLKNLGELKINKKADILLFQQVNSEKIYLDSLKYVIKNGSVYKIQ